MIDHKFLSLKKLLGRNYIPNTVNFSLFSSDEERPMKCLKIWKKLTETELPWIEKVGTLLDKAGLKSACKAIRKLKDNDFNFQKEVPIIKLNDDAYVVLSELDASGENVKVKFYDKGWEQTVGKVSSKLAAKQAGMVIKQIIIKRDEHNEDNDDQ